MIATIDDKYIFRSEVAQIVETTSRAALSGSGSFSLVSGPAGIGKTTLLIQLRQELAQRSIFPLILQYDFPSSPTLSEAISVLLRQMDYLRPGNRFFDEFSSYQRNLTSVLLADYRSSSTDLVDPPTNNDLNLLMQQSLLAAARDENHGLILILEDLHHAGPQILSFVEGIGRFLLIEKLPASLILSCRQSPDSESILRRLEDLCQELSSFVNLHNSPPFVSRHFKLEHLDYQSLLTYLDRLFRAGFSQANKEFCQWLYHQSGGLPYYLHLLLNAAGEQGIIYQDADLGWTANSHFDRLRLPETIEELLWSKIEMGLSDPETRQALECLAALGSPARFDDWQKVSGRPRKDFIETLIFLEERGLARDMLSDREHLVLFAHPLIGELILERMDHASRWYWAQKVSSYLDENGHPDYALNRLTHLTTKAQIPLPLLSRALEVAKCHKDWHAILNWYQLLSHLKDESGRLLWLSALEASREAAQPKRCLEIGKAGQDFLPQLSVAERLRYYQCLHSCLITTSPDACQELLLDAETWVGSLSPADSKFIDKELSFLRLTYYQETNDFENCLALGEKLKKEWAGDSLFILRIENTLGLVYIFRGDWKQAEQLYRERVLPLESIMPTDYKAKAFFNMAKVLSRLAQYDQAEVYFLKAKDLCEQERLYDILLTLQADLAAMRWRQGRHRQALEGLEAAYRVAFVNGNLKVQSVVLDSIVGVRGELGENEGLPALLLRNLSIKESLGNDLGRACTMINLSECYLRGLGTEPDYQVAYEWSLKSLELLRRIGSRKFLAEAMINLSQSCLLMGHRAEALEHAQAAVRLAAETSSPQTIALAQGCLGQVLAEINPRSAEGLLTETIAFFERLGNRYEMACHLVMLGRLRRKAGNLSAASESIALAANIYRELNLDTYLAKLLDEFPDASIKPAISIIAPTKPKGSQVRILTLGPLQFYPLDKKEPAPMGAKGQMARKIVAFVISQDYKSRRGIPRQRLLEEFWGGSHGGNSMRVILSRLKVSLGLPLLYYRNGLYHFPWDDQRIYLDWEHLELLLHQAAVSEKKGDLEEAWAYREKAESLFRGRYLEDIDEPWAHNPRKRLLLVHQQLLSKLVELSEKIGKHKQADLYRQKILLST